MSFSLYLWDADDPQNETKRLEVSAQQMKLLEDMGYIERLDNNMLRITDKGREAYKQYRRDLESMT